MPRNGRRGGGGPLNNVVGLVSTGVGAVAEYNAHRKEVKQQRPSSGDPQEQGRHLAGPSPLADSRDHDQEGNSSDLPPTYDEASQADSSGGDRSLASGGPALDKKGALKQYDDNGVDSDSTLSTEDDERDWQLDEVDRQCLPSYVEVELQRPVDDLVRDVMSTYRPLERDGVPHSPLSLPVIIPQRRPGNRMRGFCRAYSPILEDAGIDQTTFINFIETFEKSSRASPIFGVIQLAAGIAGLAPSGIAMAVTIAVQVAAKTGAEIQARQRTNNFLDKMNQELFQPNGLYAFIMKYTPDNAAAAGTYGISAQKVDVSTNQIIAKYSRPLSNDDGGRQSTSERFQNFRLTSGATQGAGNIPESAPLVFPAVDRAIALDGAEQTYKTKAKDAGSFLADYLDRRAQMKYASEDPNSALRLPEEQRAMRSKFADPTHPMWSGGLITLASGGYIGGTKAKEAKYNKRQESDYYRDARRAQRLERRLQRGRHLSGRDMAEYEHFVAENEKISQQGGFGSRPGLVGAGAGPGMRVGGLVGTGAGPFSGAELARTESEELQYQRYRDVRRQQRRGDGRVGLIKGVKKVLHEDVLYLMVVNMPSEAELREAQEELERAKQAM